MNGLAEVLSDAQLFPERWEDTVKRLALARKNVGGDPATRTPRQRLEYRAISAELDRVLEAVPS